MTLSVSAAYTGFVVYSLLNGVTLSLIFVVYALYSIFIVFAVAATMFLAMGLFGYFTGWISPDWPLFLMSLFGLIIASVANFFLRSSTLDFAVSVVGVLIFAGLTAYDMQYLKNLFASNAMSDEENHKLSILGALKLYLDFINLFLWLLRIFGRRR
jgi:FtsH-binding integral membrane protein